MVYPGGGGGVLKVLEHPPKAWEESTDYKYTWPIMLVADFTHICITRTLMLCHYVSSLDFQPTY